MSKELIKRVKNMLKQGLREKEIDLEKLSQRVITLVEKYTNV